VLYKKNKPFQKRRLNPAQVLAIGFVVAILTGSLLLSLPVATESGQPLPWIDALFTATSAVCVTGLVVVDTAQTFSTFGEMVILLLIQTGGLGIMTLTTLFAMILGRKIGVQERLVLREAFNQLDLQGVVSLVLKVFLITLIVEGAGFVALSFCFVPDWGVKKGLYYALFHAVSAFNQGGFDLFGETRAFAGLTAYVHDPWVNLIVGFLVILGGIGFIVILELIHYPKTKRLSLHTKLVLTMTGLLLGIGMLVILFTEWNNPQTMQSFSLKEKLLASFFHAVTPRTAGFQTLELSHMYPATLFFTILLMFVGASPSSIGGGIKTTTLAVILLAVWTMMRGRQDVVAFRRRIPTKHVYKALTITVASLTLVIIVTMLLAITEQTDILSALFEAVSAVGTVGLSTGLTPHLSEMGKIILIFSMFAGRLGPITLALAIARDIDPPPYRYPEERPLIG
jgi:trk system potassium uptake protein